MPGTYLVTGGAGNLSCQLAYELNNAERIVLYDIAPAPVAAVPAKCTYVRGDLTDPAAVRQVIDKYQPSKVIHFASLLSGQSERDSRLAWRLNMDATFDLFELLTERGLPVLFPSSVASFGQPPSASTDPSPHPQWPHSLYGVTKVAAERLGWYLHAAKGLDFRCVRLPIVISPFAPAGAASSFASRSFVEAKQNGRYTFPVGPSIRSGLAYWRDAVRGMAELLEAPAARLTTRVYGMIGTGPSAQEIADAIHRQMPKAALDFKPDEAVERIIRSWPSQIDDAAARTDWGWKPRFDLDAIAADMLRSGTI